MFGIASLLGVVLVLGLDLVQEGNMQADFKEGFIQTVPEAEESARTIIPSNVTEAFSSKMVVESRDESINIMLPYMIGLITASMAFIIIKRLFY